MRRRSRAVAARIGGLRLGEVGALSRHGGIKGLRSVSHTDGVSLLRGAGLLAMVDENGRLKVPYGALRHARNSRISGVFY